ncbi:MAG: nucleotide exchange factor GrpE [Alphaproteobacteria bacterium]
MTEANDKPEEEIQETAAAEADASADAAADAAEAGEPASAWAKDDADAEPDDTAEAAADAMVLEMAELRDKLLRSLAENENLLRRAKREREDTAKYAAANFARDMLAVADNLGRALEAVPDGLRGMDGGDGFLDGIELTDRELRATLERHGITRISPLGEKFNHDRHEALFEVPTADADPGTIVQVLQDGYVIHDRLLRAARVGIAKALPQSGGDDNDGDDRSVDTTA